MAEGWKVTSQRQTKAYTNGEFMDVMEVRFVTDHGVSGVVDVPLSSYGDADYVRKLIQGRVDAIDAVHGL
jgi:hypothetical protein